MDARDAHAPRSAQLFAELAVDRRQAPVTFDRFRRGETPFASLRLRISNSQGSLSLAPGLKNIPAHFVVEMLTVPMIFLLIVGSHATGVLEWIVTSNSAD